MVLWPGWSSLVRVEMKKVLAMSIVCVGVYRDIQVRDSDIIGRIQIKMNILRNMDAIPQINAA